jgi:subtilisin-like proprotein convertase family protein
VFTEKLRQRVLSQTSLAQVNSETTDYDLNGQITAYDVSVAAITGDQTSSKNRLTITVNIEFENRKTKKPILLRPSLDLRILIQIKIFKAWKLNL